MRWVLTSDEMRGADEYTVNEKKIPTSVLMERAGARLCERAEKLAPTGKILCVCGGGEGRG